MTTPLVSIITPSYNQVRYLETTICSVLEQEYPRLEYLIVDGASTDGSVDIIQRYADKLTWWVSEPDKGQADAINKGLLRAQGEIVAWLNSDDYYLPGAIETAVRAFQENEQCGLVFGDVLAVDGQGHTLNLLRYAPRSLADLMSFQIIGQPSVFMRRSVLEQAGLLDLDYHYLLDHHLWIRMAAIAPTHYLPVTLSAARFHSEAKNVAQAAQFGHEAHLIVAWMESDPKLSATYAEHSRRINAGAYVVDAFYLLDGNKAGAALKAYIHAFFIHPKTMLIAWRRVLYALLSILGLRSIGSLYRRARQRMFNHD